MANYPTSIPSFTTKANGGLVDATHPNAIQDEVVAIGTDLLKAWSSVTPTWTNLSVGNATTNTTKYIQIGKFVLFKIDLVWGNSTSISGSVSVSLPVTAVSTASFTIAHGEAIDASTGDAITLHGRVASGTTLAVLTDNGTKLVNATSTVPFTWADLDELHLLGFYEAA